MNFNINILLQLYVVWVKIYCKPQEQLHYLLLYFKSSNAVKQVVDPLGYYERFSFWIAMKFKVTKSSDYTYESTIEINTLEELIEFQKTCECEIILIDENEIEIYDDFRE